MVTGTPVRGEFFQITRQQARDALGIKDDRPLVLSYWGSLGAEVMNGYMVDFLRQAARDGAPFHHIHGAGRNFAAMEKALAGDHLPPALQEFIRLRVTYPDATLKELGERATPPLSKSAVYHRVRRIEQMAKELHR